MATRTAVACETCRRERLITSYGRCTVCGEEVLAARRGSNLLLRLRWIVREYVIPLGVAALVLAGVRLAWRVGEEGGGNLLVVSVAATLTLFLLGLMTQHESARRR